MFNVFRRQVVLQEKGNEEHSAYPALENLIGAYFHQDYDIISENPDEIVSTFREWNGPDFVRQVVTDINAFLSKYASDEQELDKEFRRTFRPEAPFAG